MDIDEDLTDNDQEDCVCWKLENNVFYKALECGSEWCKLYRGKTEDKSKE